MGKQLPVVEASRSRLREAVIAGAILITLLLMGGLWSLFLASEPLPALDPATSRGAASVSGRLEELGAIRDQRVDASQSALGAEAKESSDPPSTVAPDGELPPWKEFRLKEIENRWTKLLQEVGQAQQDPFNAATWLEAPVQKEETCAIN